MAFHVLIIDDDASFKKLLELRLKSFIPDMRVTYLDRIGAARAYLTKEKPTFDLVILDEHLPDGRGVELLTEGWFEHLAVLAVSSDDDPAIPGASLKAGAAYFLSKLHVSELLFKPLVQGIIDRNRIQRELAEVRTKALVMDTVKTMVGTLRHEINNPLGAVLGAAYLLRNLPKASPEQQEAAELVDQSGKRIKHVLDQLCEAIELEPVTKADQKVFHIPGDAPWAGGTSKVPGKG